MSKPFFASAFLMLSVGALPAQSLLPSNPQTMALAGASVASDNPDGNFSNPASLAGCTAYSFYSGFYTPYNALLFRHVSAGALIPLPRGGFSVSAGSFGDRLYSERSLSAAVAHRIEAIGLGVRADLLQMSVDGQGSVRMPVFEAGATARIHKKTVFGGRVYNLLPLRLGRFQSERLPVFATLGISHAAGPKTTISFQADQALGGKTSFGAGMEYKASENAVFRWGCGGMPRRVSGGLSLSKSGWRAEYAFSFMADARGLSQQFRLSRYIVGKR